MKIGIRAALQALLEADDQIGGRTLGESALTLVRRHRATQASARTLRSGVERLKHELTEAHQSETRTLARLEGACDAANNLRAQITALAAERDALAAARDALEHQLATTVGHYNAAQLTLSDACAKWEADERTYFRDCTDIAKQRDKALAELAGVRSQLRVTLDGKPNKVPNDTTVEILAHEVQGYGLELEGQLEALVHKAVGK